MEEGPGFESNFMQGFFSEINVDYHMGAGVVWAIPISIVLDINALGGIQLGSTLDYLSVDGDLSG